MSKLHRALERFKTIHRRDWFEIVYKIASLAAGSFLVIALVAGGIWLLYHGKSLEGFGAIGVAAAAIFGAALFRRVQVPPPTTEPGKK